MKTESFEFELEADIRSCARLIVIESKEEDRAIAIVQGICRGLARRCVTFDIAEGFAVVEGGNCQMPSTKDPIAALEQIERRGEEAVYVLRDFHEVWNQPGVKRKLRNVVERLLYKPVSLVVTCPDGTRIPAELADLAQRRQMPLPGTEELGMVFDELARSPEVKIRLSSQERERLLQAALGLTLAQARRVFGHVMVKNQVSGSDAIVQVAAQKARLLENATGLEFCTCVEGLEEVGGVEELKRWVLLRRAGFGQEAQQYGLEPPKGVLLVGIPGTGKSLMARVVAKSWGLPLARFDIARLYNSLLGQSEENLRAALAAAETAAPLVVWIDEVEKAVAQSNHDGGTSSRLFGALCTWMADRTAPVFVVATANDIGRLPAEFLRKGRFDEIFFIGLPSRQERKAIFAIHLRKRQRNPMEFDLDALEDASVDRTGAEIEQAIKDALYQTYADGKRLLKTEDIIAALDRQIPLAISQHEVIEGLQEFVRQGRARPASLPEDEQTACEGTVGHPKIKPV